LRAGRWAVANLDNAAAVPPSPLAGRLLALGRKHPDRLVVCLARMEALSRKPQPQQSPKLNGTVDDGIAHECEARRLKKLFVREDQLLSCIGNERGKYYVYKPPSDAHVVACHANPSQREIEVVIHSSDFPVVAADEPIPALERELNY
jgi:hypothetical protein